MRYQNPSIVEALCEWTFAPETHWDSTIFGLIYDRIRVQFPLREERGLIETTIKAASDAIGHDVRRSPMMVFSNEDRTRLVQVAEHLLVVNVLAPYPHWGEFKRLINEATRVYNEVAQPRAVAKTVLRYIDQFEFEAEGFRLGNWFNCSGDFFPRVLANQDSAAIYRVRFPQSESEHFALSLGVRPSDDGTKRIGTLDSEIVHLDILEATPDANQTLDQMHIAIIDVFEGCITDKLRARLSPTDDSETTK